MAVAAAVLVVAVVGWWWWRLRPSRQAEALLRRICFGDDDQVERLIDLEMARAPQSSRAEAASRAVLRYQRDNR